MRVRELYQQLEIPPNLQRHMAETATLARDIFSRWFGVGLNKSLVMKGLMVHDLGNIVKFRRPFFGELEAESEKWLRIQQKWIEKYGNNANIATLRVLKESGVEKEVYQLVAELTTYQMGELSEKLASWECMLAEFTDLCVSPAGIVGFDARCVDLQTRYGNSVEYGLIPKGKRLKALVQQYTSVDLDAIKDAGLSADMSLLDTVELEIS